MRTQYLLSIAIAVLLSNSAFAARVAVVDSGTDFEHVDLAGKILLNSKEVPGNRVDDDRNGKVDDVVGWNFVDNYNRVFFSEHLENYNPIVYRIMEVVARRQSGKATPSDQAFWEKTITNLSAEQRRVLIAHLNSFGQYIHGTHVAGIVAAEAPEAPIMSLRVFADQPPPEYAADSARLMSLVSPVPNLRRDLTNGGSSMSWTSLVYRLLAAVSSGMFDQAAKYLNEQQIDVANYSLGVPLQVIARALLAAKGVKEPTPEQLSQETWRAYRQYESYGKKWMSAAPNTLFVVASGNDGTDNDVLPTFPSNVDVPNSIRVAASLDYAGLADFSNFGVKSVDVAAPGVAIDSTVPSLDRKARLPLSGTSMAAPYVAGVAARIKQINPRLTPAEIKMVLMETVDKKDWLKGKVVSEGVVNAERAYQAAADTRIMDLARAIAKSKSIVMDVKPKVLPKAQNFFVSDELLDEAAQQLVF